MKKIISLALLAVMSLCIIAGCASNSDASSEAAAPDTSAADTAEKTTVRVGALNGPTAMGMVKLMDDDEANATANDYEFTVAAAIDEVTPKIVQGELDIAAVPANMSSVLYNNTDGAIDVLAVNTLGVLYIVETGDTVQSVEDLRGKTIYASGKGATPEYALNYILRENGIDPEKDVTIEYKSEHAECVTAITSAENGIAMLPQPFVTTAQTKNEDIRIALDLTKEWENVQKDATEKSAMITGVVVVRKAFLEENSDAVNTFLTEYKASIEYVNSNVDAAAELIGEYNIVPAPVAKKALPYCNITFVEGDDMKTQLRGYLNTLLEQNPKSIGGKLPDDSFYYSR